MSRSSGWPAAAAVTAVSALALSAVAPVAAAAEPAADPSAVGTQAACRVHRLPAPADTVESVVLEGDPSGRWLAGWYADADGSTDTTWKNGKRFDLESPQDDFWIRGINRHGDVVGVGLFAGVARSYVSQDGEFVELTAPGAAAAYAQAINSDGTVSGAVTIGDETVPAAWDALKPDDPTLFSVPSGHTGEAVEVNERGEFALLAWPDTGRLRSFFLGRDDRRRPLRPSRADWEPQVRSIANGWAVGVQRSPDHQDQEVLRWDLSDRRRPQVVQTALTEVNSVNSHGVVGGELPAEFGSFPALLVGEKTKILPGLVEDGKGAVNVVADNGQAAGYAADEHGYRQAVTWTC